MHTPRSLLLLALFLSSLGRAAEDPIYTDPGELPHLQTTVDGREQQLPLVHTHVSAYITGYVAEVEVSQTYDNTFEHPIEAVYIFPLPENSAVFAMKMAIGERVIESEVQRRAEARRTYEEARRSGHTSALLEQERPNVFTQKVANIAPGTQVEIVLRYLQTLTYDAGEYEFVFPMVVGPRFFPGEALSRAPSGSGTQPDTTMVPDASRVSPPYLGAGTRSGHDISLEVTVDAGLPVRSYEVPTHDVEVAPAGDGPLLLRLAPHARIPNRDFVLHYHVAGKEPAATLLAHNGEEGGFFTLIVQPPELDVDALVGRRELIFVVDVSGSMSGVPLSMCQDAMEHAIAGMRPVDTFNVITFAGRSGQVFESPRPANDTNVRQALAYVRSLSAGGGTYMADAIAAALSVDVEPGRNRYVFFMTDGYVGNEGKILELTDAYVRGLDARGQKTRVFGFGVGSSVNRYLIDGLGKSGRGLALYATTREDPTLAVNAFYGVIDHPVLEDLAIDWGDVHAEEVYPARLPDLFATRPLVVHGRYSGSGRATVILRGKSHGQFMQLPLEVDLPPYTSGTSAHEVLWARAKVDGLSRELWTGESSRVVEEIADVGLTFHLVTAYTSLVAVDRSRTVAGRLQTIVQPVAVPEGVDIVKAGGRFAGLLGGGTLGAPRESAGTGVSGFGRGVGLAALGSSGRLGGGGVSYGVGLGKRIDQHAIEMSAPVVVGALSRGAVDKVVGINKKQIRYCYERELQKNPSLTGRVVLKWVIRKDGKVATVTVLESTVGNLALEQCIMAKVKSWRFAALRDGGIVEVTYPFVLAVRADND